MLADTHGHLTVLCLAVVDGRDSSYDSGPIDPPITAATARFSRILHLPWVYNTSLPDGLPD